MISPGGGSGGLEKDPPERKLELNDRKEDDETLGEGMGGADTTVAGGTEMGGGGGGAVVAGTVGVSAGFLAVSGFFNRLRYSKSETFLLEVLMAVLAPGLSSNVLSLLVSSILSLFSSTVGTFSLSGSSSADTLTDSWGTFSSTQVTSGGGGGGGGGVTGLTGLHMVAGSIPVPLSSSVGLFVSCS